MAERLSHSEPIPRHVPEHLTQQVDELLLGLRRLGAKQPGELLTQLLPAELRGRVGDVWADRRAELGAGEERGRRMPKELSNLQRHTLARCFSEECPP